MIQSSEWTWGPSARNLLSESCHTGIDGARAACETFYHAFNNRDSALFQKILLPHPLSQLNDPLGGILKGYAEIVSLYDRIFNSPAKVWLELSDITEMGDHNFVLFTGREKGEFESGAQLIELNIRTSRLFTYDTDSRSWKQVHHHGSIDDAALLAIYQEAVE